jgi:hypothetical protein
LAFACHQYRLPAHIDALPAEAVAADLLSCVVRSDHELAGRPVPVDGRRGRAFERYLQVRSRAAAVPLAAALAGWAVSAHLPEHWLPEAGVRAQLGRLLERYGSGGVTNVVLAPPTPGARTWAVRLGAGGLRALAALEPGTSRAALLQWPDRTVAAVVRHREGQLRAFGAGFPAAGQPIDPAMLLAAYVLPPALPPLSWFRLALRWLSLRWPGRRRRYSPR